MKYIKIKNMMVDKSALNYACRLHNLVWRSNPNEHAANLEEPIGQSLTGSLNRRFDGLHPTILVNVVVAFTIAFCHITMLMSSYVLYQLMLKVNTRN